MKENSIEEAIERLEKGINDIWFSTTYSQEQEEKDLKILLADYKRVLKENEELKLYNNSIISQLEQMTTEKFKKSWIHQSEFKDFILVQKAKDKIIDLMSEQLTTPVHDKEYVKQYFKNKANGGNER